MQANYAAAVSVNTLQRGLLSALLYDYDPDFPSTKTVYKNCIVVVWCVKCHMGVRWDHQTHFHLFSKWWLQQWGTKLGHCCSWINLRCLIYRFFLLNSWPEVGTSPVAPFPSNTYAHLLVSIKQTIYFCSFISLLTDPPALHSLLFLIPQMLSAL